MGGRNGGSFDSRFAANLPNADEHEIRWFSNLSELDDVEEEEEEDEDNNENADEHEILWFSNLSEQQLSPGRREGCT